MCMFAKWETNRKRRVDPHLPSFIWQSWPELPLTFMQTTKDSEWIVAPSSNCACTYVCVHGCVSARHLFFFFFAGTSRDKAPSARSRLSWLPASLAGAGERLSVSIVTKRTLPPLFLLRCLLMLTANNVLLDGCALLEPESRAWD